MITPSSVQSFLTSTTRSNVPHVVIITCAVAVCAYLSTHLFGTNWILRIVDWIELKKRERGLREPNFVHTQLIGLYPKDIFSQSDYYVPPYITRLDSLLQPFEVTEKPINAVVFLKKFIVSDGRDNRADLLVIINDAGMGKTSLLLNYVLKNEYAPTKHKINILLVRLKSGSAKIDEKLVAFPEQDKHRTVVFLDGLDEDPSIHNDSSVKRIVQLLNYCRGFHKTILTSRRDSFVNLHDSLLAYLQMVINPSKAANSPMIEVIRLEQLTTRQIHDILLKRFPRIKYPLQIVANRRKRNNAQQLIDQIKQDAFRPMLLEHIHDITDLANQSDSDSKLRRINTLWDLYEKLVTFWEEREKQRLWDEEKNTLPQKIYDGITTFCRLAALYVYFNRLGPDGEFIPAEVVNKLLDAVGVDRKNYIQTVERSLLRQTDNNDFWEFAHRSIGEFVFVSTLIDPPINLKEYSNNRVLVPWTELMKRFAIERLQSQRGDYRLVDLSKGNLQYTDLKGSDFSGADLRGVNLQGAICKNVKFINSKLDSAILLSTIVDGADFSGASLHEAQIINVSLRKALNLNDEQLSKADVKSIYSNINSIRRPVIGNLSLAFSLGEMNTVVFEKAHEIVYWERSVVAVETNSNNILAVGNEAIRLVSKSPNAFSLVKLFGNDIISDLQITTGYFQHIFATLYGRTQLVHPSVIIAVPLSIKEIQVRALKECVENAGARNVQLIDNIKATAVGAQLPVSEPLGNMIIDIGYKVTEIAVISMNAYIYSHSIIFGGSNFDAAISEYVMRRYDMIIGEWTSEQIKIRIASLDENNLGGVNIEMKVTGRMITTGAKNSVKLTTNELRSTLLETMHPLVDTLKMVMNQSSSEVLGDFMSNGITLSGGSSELRGLDNFLTQQFGIQFTVTGNPSSTAAMGAGKLLM